MGKPPDPPGQAGYQPTGDLSDLTAPGAKPAAMPAKAQPWLTPPRPAAPAAPSPLSDPPGQSGYSPIQGNAPPGIFEGPSTKPTQDMRALPGARTAPPLHSAGTPVQIKNGACGHCVMQGMIRDAGGGYVEEGHLFGGKFRLRGTNAKEFATELSRFGGDVQRFNNVRPEHLRVALDNGYQVVVGIKTRTMSDHWVRVEGVDGGFVHYGDPWTGQSHVVSIKTFAEHMDPHGVVVAKWPNGVKLPRGMGRPSQPSPARPGPPRAGGIGVDEPVHPQLGLSGEVDETLHGMGLKKHIQIVRGTSDVSVHVIGPDGGVTETIHYIPTSPSSTQKAAQLLSRATLANPADVAMVLETGGRVMFIYDAFRSFIELSDPQTSLNLLDKYAQVLHEGARAAEEGKWELASAALAAWSKDMAALGGPFEGMGGGFLLWLHDHWLTTFGADAISHAPPKYLMWLYTRTMNTIAQMRRDLVQRSAQRAANADAVSAPVDVTEPSDVPSPAPRDSSEAPPLAPGRPQATFAGLTAKDLDVAIGQAAHTVAEINAQIADITSTLEYFRNWHDHALAARDAADDSGASDAHYSPREVVNNELSYVERQEAYCEHRLNELQAHLAQTQDRMRAYGEARDERVPPEVVADGIPTEVTPGSDATPRSIVDDLQQAIDDMSPPPLEWKVPPSKPAPTSWPEPKPTTEMQADPSTSLPVGPEPQLYQVPAEKPYTTVLGVPIELPPTESVRLARITNNRRYTITAIGVGVAVLLAAGGYEGYTHFVLPAPTIHSTGGLMWNAAPLTLTYIHTGADRTQSVQPETDQVQSDGHGGSFLTLTRQNPGGTLVTNEHLTAGGLFMTGYAFTGKSGDTITRECGGVGVPLLEGTHVGAPMSFLVTCTGTGQGKTVTDKYEGTLAVVGTPMVTLGGKKMQAELIERKYTIVTGGPGLLDIVQNILERRLYVVSPLQLASLSSFETITGSGSIDISSRESLDQLDPQDWLTQYFSTH